MILLEFGNKEFFLYV